MEDTASLAIQRKVFRKGLAHQHFRTFTSHNPHSSSVLVEPVPQTLVGDIDEWKMPSGLQLLCQNLPLRNRKVGTDWILATPLEREDGSWRCISNSRKATLEINTVGSRVQVPVRFGTKTDLLEQGNSIPPSRSSNEYCWIRLDIRCQQQGRKVVGTSSRECLNGRNLHWA